MNEWIKIEVTTTNPNYFVFKMLAKNITLANIKYNKDNLTCLINKNDYEKIKHYYDIKIINELSFLSFLNKLRTNILKLFCLLFALTLFLTIKNVIVATVYIGENKEIIQELSKELDKYDIKRFTFKKDYDSISKIKNQVIENLQNKIEWLSIKAEGMKYIISFEERKVVLPNETLNDCDIVSNSDAIVTKIIASKGVVMVNKNDYVKEGSILISGNVYLNEELKSRICAEGLVYGEKWYTVNISLPTIYQEKKYTNKYRYNLLIENNNKDYKIFKSRLKNYDTSSKELISLFGKKLILLKENEYIYEEKNFTNEELDNYIDKLIAEKINLSLKDNEQILYKNVLKKSSNNSKIDIEVFVTVEKLISKIVSNET